MAFSESKVISLRRQFVNLRLLSRKEGLKKIIGSVNDKYGHA